MEKDNTPHRGGFEGEQAHTSKQAEKEDSTACEANTISNPARSMWKNTAVAGIVQETVQIGIIETDRNKNIIVCGNNFQLQQ